MSANTAMIPSITKTKVVSTGVTVSPLHDGRFAVAAHEGDKRVVVCLEAEEFRSLVEQLTALAQPMLI